MKTDQECIYYITAESFLSAKSSPHLEIFRKKGIEVLLLSDRVDEWLVSNLPEFDGKKLKSVTMGKLDIKDDETEVDEEKKAQTEKDFESILKQVKEVLGDKIKEVRLTDRLTDSPACVVADEGFSMHMQRLMSSAGQTMPKVVPTLELNPKHRLIEQLKNEQDDDRFADWTLLLFDQAMLAEAGHLEDPAAFVQRINKYLK